jgi:quinohemoprotein ethanol dehydrogenase
VVGADDAEGRPVRDHRVRRASPAAGRDRNAGSEYAVRGFLSAYDASTGRLAWKTYLVPGDPSKPFEQEALRSAAATWSGQWYKAAAARARGIRSSTIRRSISSTSAPANANPWYPELRGDKEGDNLFASSIVAIRASTGEIVWHYQTTPGDSWDYDATQPITLADLTIDGRPRKVLMQPNKNAFLYVIDRENGKLISATPYASMTWATGIDSSGRPIVNPAAKPTKAGVIVSPADYGAHNWNPTSFSPTTGFLYLSVTDGGVLLHVVDPIFKLNANDATMGIDPRYDGPLTAKRDSVPPAKGRLVAWNPVTKREAWRVEHPVLRSGGTLSTAGNLVFQGAATASSRRIAPPTARCSGSTTRRWASRRRR